MAFELNVNRVWFVNAAFTLLCGCAIASEMPARWRVVDPTTTPPTPVAGATVIAIYETASFAPGGTVRRCEGVHMTYADAEGWFQVPERGPRPRLVAHKPGYSHPTKGVVVTRDGLVFLKPAALPQDRLLHISGLTAGAICGDPNPEIAAFLESLVPELHSIADSPERKSVMRELEAVIKFERGRK